MGYLLIFSYDKIYDCRFLCRIVEYYFFRFSIMSVSDVIILFLQVGSVYDICY